MTLFFVRHGKAGSRAAWSGPDDLRPLVKSGRRQAEALVALLADRGVTKIVSSPYVRCRQTVGPLAEVLRLPVDLSDALAEGASLHDALRLVEKVGDEQAVLCSHGDVMTAVLDHARAQGAKFQGDGLEKGSCWALEIKRGAVVAARYVPEPS